MAVIVPSSFTVNEVAGMVCAALPPEGGAPTTKKTPVAVDRLTP